MFLGALPTNPQSYMLKRNQVYTFIFDSTALIKPSIDAVRKSLAFVNILGLTRSFGTTVGTGTLRYYVNFSPRADVPFQTFINFVTDVGTFRPVDLIIDKVVVAPTVTEDVTRVIKEVVKIPVEVATETTRGIAKAFEPIKWVALIGVTGYLLFLFGPMIKTISSKISKRA